MRRLGRILLFFSLAIPPQALADAVDEVASHLLCQCGHCAYILGSCGMHSCGSRAKMTERIEKDIASGKDQNTILQDFAIRYGIKVLATPPAEGFNLLVWILPVLGGGLGLMTVGGVVSALRKRSPVQPAQPPPKIDSGLLQRVEKELKKYSQ